MKIGPTFAAELAAANIAGLPFAWGADGKFEFDPSMTSQQRAAVLAVLAVHDPEAVSVDTDQARLTALEAMVKLPAYRPALDKLIADAALDADAPESVKEAGEVIGNGKSR